MYDPPLVVWAITLTGVVAIPVAACAALCRGAQSAGLPRRQVLRLTAGAGVLLGGWLVVSALIAGSGGYRTRLGHGVPWLPVAFAGAAVTLLLLSRIPVIAAVLAAPGMTRRLQYPHLFRVAGVSFVIVMALGHLPALFALPAGLGDLSVGLVEPLIARRLARGDARRSLIWFNLLGLTDLVVALVLGGLTGFRVIPVTPSAAPSARCHSP